jgi:putative MATE family efflux protein
MKPFDEELVSGSVVRSVWKLAWPLVANNLINGVHSLVDHVLCGQYVGSDANAAIGAAWQTFLMVIVFVASLFQGMTVLVARYAGRQDRDTLSEVAWETFKATILILVVVAPAGWFAAPCLLQFVAASAEVQAQAVPYLRVLFVCSFGLFLNFMVNYGFHAAGEPKVPLYLGILTTTVNVVLSFLLIVGIGPIPPLGTLGAGLATALAPLPGVAIALSLVIRRRTIIQPPPVFSLRLDLSILKQLAAIGLPTGLQAFVLNLGGFLLLRYIKLLDNGADAQAAYVICYSQLFAFITWASFGLRGATATSMGQNLGAGNVDRARKCVYSATAMGAGWAAALGLVYVAMPGPLLSLFDAEPGVRQLGVELLRFLSASGVVLAVTLALTGGLQGAGDTRTPMWIAGATQFGVLLGLCEVMRQAGLLSATGIWAAILTAHTTRLVLTAWAFRKGAWENIQVRVHPRAE